MGIQFLEDSARDVENGVSSGMAPFQRFNCFRRGPNDQLDLAALRFALQLLHHRQATVSSCADDQPLAFPGDLLFDRQRRVSKLVAKLLGRLFLALANLAAINDHVVVVGDAVDSNRTEGKISDAHIHLPQADEKGPHRWAVYCRKTNKSTSLSA